MKVSEFHENNPRQLELVSPDSTIDEVYVTMVKDLKTRAVYVVDHNKKLLGLIEIGNLIHLYGAKYASGPIDILSHFSEFLADKAKDIMRAPISVKMDDSLKTAIKLMLESQIYDIAVVDKKNTVQGSINCFELLEVLRKE